MSQYSYLDENQKNDKMDDQVDENEGANISLCFAHEKTSEINLMILPKILHSKKEVAEWKEMRSPDYWIKRAAEQKRLEEEANSATIDNLNNRFITSSNGNSVELVDLESVSGTVVECSGWSISPDVEMSQEDSAVWEKKLEDIQKAFTLEKQADQNRIKELEETVQRLQQKQNSAEESSGQLENVPGTSQTCDLGSAVHLTDKSEREADQRRIKELEEMLENLPKSGEAAKNLGGLDYALDDETSPSPVLNFSDTVRYYFSKNNYTRLWKTCMIF